jgi:hypothetical protein
MSKIDEIEARLGAAPEGPYHLGDASVYKLNERGSNYFYAGIQPAGSGSASLLERRAVARLFQSSPTDLRYLLDFAKAAREAFEGIVKAEHCIPPEDVDAALASICSKARETLLLLGESTDDEPASIDGIF